MRPKRGKYLPMLPPDSESEEDSSEASSESSNSEQSGPEPEEDTVETVAGEVVADKPVEEEEEDDDDADEEEEEDDHHGVGGVTTRRLRGKFIPRDVEPDNDDNMEDDDDDEEDFRPPPTPRVTTDRRRNHDREDTPLDIRDPQDVGRIYSELIDTCNSIEMDAGLDKNFKDVMSKNIEKGRALFERLMKGSSGPTNEEFDEYGNRRRTVGGAGDMYLAYLHTNISSNIVRNCAERIGTGTNIFSVEGFLESLQNEFVDEDGDYSPKLAAANIAMQSAVGAKTLMPLVAVVGTFDRDAVIVPKGKKPRAPPRKMNAEDQQEGSTAYDASLDSTLPLMQKSPADNVAKEMHKILKVHYRQSLEPVNLFEFVLDRSSFPKTIENIFYMSFLVKDGHVSLTKEENGKLKDLSLTIKPEKANKQTNPSQDNESTRNQKHRQKYILSFSPKMWKTLCELSQGENTIQFYQDVMERQALPAIQDR